MRIQRLIVTSGTAVAVAVGFLLAGTVSAKQAKPLPHKAPSLLVSVHASPVVKLKDGVAPLVMVVLNPTGDEVVKRFPSSQKYDFLVERDGQTVWRWSQDKSFSQSLRESRFSPLEPVVFVALWKLSDARGVRVTAGRYRVTAVLTTDEREVSKPITIEVR